MGAIDPDEAAQGAEGVDHADGGSRGYDPRPCPVAEAAWLRWFALLPGQRLLDVAPFAVTESSGVRGPVIDQLAEQEGPSDGGRPSMMDIHR